MPMQPAVLGTARLNNFRLNYLPAALSPIRATKVGIYLSGVRITGAVKVGNLRISDILNDAPNTCGFTYYGPTAPQPNQKLVVTLDADFPIVLFSGTLQTVAISYVGRPSTVAWECAAIDDTALANRRRPFGVWNRVSATAVAIELITTYAPDLSTAGIEAGLPLVDIFLDGTEGMSAAFAQMANLIGGYYKFEEGIAFLFLELLEDPCDPIDAGHPFLNDPPIAESQDVSQLRTRVYGRGHGEVVPVDVVAGETILPVEDAVMFDPLGGRAIVTTTPDGSPTLILGYTGLQATEGGALVGPGVTPSTAPAVTIAAGAGLALGVYEYAFAWVTAAGSTLVGPRQSVTTYDVVPIGPSIEVPNPQQSEYGYYNPVPHRLTAGATYRYGYTFVTDYGETVLGNVSPGIVADANFGVNIYLTYAGLSQSVAHGIITGVRFYRSVNGGTFRLFGSQSGGFASPVYDLYLGDADIASAATPPSVGTANIPAFRRVNIAGVAVGPSGTTSRRVYRTAVNASQLKLQQTIANNTATAGVQDATADGSLGANAPASDTAGLTQATGQYNAGATSILTTGAGSFAPTGGWFITSSGDRVRYAAVSGNSLTGIPVDGPGSIRTSVLYSTTVVPVPALTGVTGLTVPIPRGARVHIWVQRDHVPAQDTQAAIDVGNNRVLADGVYEGPILVDERRGILSLTALCDATLAIFSRPIQTVRYATRDVKTKSGKPVTVALASPPITADLVIQEVQISEIDIAPGLYPRFEVTASSTRFSLDSLLRKLTKALGV